MYNTDFHKDKYFYTNLELKNLEWKLFKVLMNVLEDSSKE